MIERLGSQQGLLASRQVENVSNIDKRIEGKMDVKGQIYGPKQSKEQMSEVIDSINSFMQPSHTSLKFELHEKLNDYYVQVIDDDTKEVIREIPSKKVLDMYVAMKEFMGLMIDEKI
ncbi:flagellar protein FlaG [Bacillus sp. B1-b2]|uniref:flagellar protein FlaG n=1 Tax=Bacillus sp. B1-b2 TaxID=2653201 RepID=UPI00126234D3|nr:flagellar protein FlaG [Bacillus sp. B1-b2]KAB7666043.1 flagellar protein FlaG [Bacillus sp. B1-b2]